MSDVDNIKNILNEIKDNPEILEDNHDTLERILLGVIKIERRHLYGMEQTSVKKRREEITKLLNKEFKEYRSEFNASSED